MQIKLIRDKEAEALLADERFCERWDGLFQVCPWASVFQSPLFAKTWFGHYRQDYSLIFLTGESKQGELTGLFCLVEEKATGTLHHVGTYHAEYQGWLALPESGDEFITCALDELRRKFPKAKLRLGFLSPGSPLGWLDAKDSLGQQSELRSYAHALVDVTDVKKFDESLRKKNNKFRLRNLRKSGELTSEFINGIEEFDEVFDKIETYSMLRISALHNVAPVTDKNRKAFHLDLLANGLIEISVMKAGENLCSAQIIMNNRDEKLLATTSMSPFFAAYSPSKIHLILLARQFAEAGSKIFDLSPGEGYKERFATRSEEAHSLDIFFDKRDFTRHMARKKLRKSGKIAFEKLDIGKSGLIDAGERILNKVANVKYSTIPRTVLKNLKRRFYEFLEMRIYALDTAKITSPENPGMMRRDSAEDLLQYEASEGWQFTRARFHQNVLERFEKGIHSYTYAEGGKLLHYGWMLERQEESDVYEVGQAFKLPPDSAVLFDYYTHPEARGRGLYKSSLIQGLHDAAKIPGTKKVFICVLADNVSSRRVIEKIGFEYQGSLFKRNILGKITKWQEWERNILDSQDEAELLTSEESWNSAIPALMNSEVTPENNRRGIS